MNDPSPSSTTADRPRGLRAAAQNLGWLLANRGLLAVLSIVYLGIAARALSIHDFGRFALITGASRALATLVMFQTWQIVVQYGVEPLHMRDEGRLARLFRACAILDGASAVVGIGLAILILDLWGDDFGIGPALWRDTVIFLVVQLVTLRSTPLGILRLRDRFSLAALADSMTPLTRFIGALIALAVMPTVQGFLYVWAAAEIVTAAVYWTIMARTGDLGRIWRARAGGRRVFDDNPGITKFALSTCANSTLGLSSNQVPLLLVGGFVGPGAAGMFRLAFQIANALAKLSQLIARAAFPEIVRLVRTRGAANLYRMLGKIFAGSSLAALVILALVAVAGKTLLTLIGGPEYAAAYVVLLWLAAAGCMELSAVGFEPLLMAVHRAPTALWSRAVAAAVMVAATVALLPRLGAVGAAIGVFMGSILAALLLGVNSIRHARRDVGDAA
ncbi:lipopolysaccharide biosynthesis protein [Stakelama saccharophila]|uniref:Lipopolysaccharide biosynthesis protein n=1 Tax=Stakelama saccharophila TaxID=3075605 RepID=A0ABZ0BA20_9SPHN|nr:lipopolysaccharide biosynthesis protein [Stakelama sp. W311]WNO54062.1 lipopolysaccharide biosynthesis protein [Stakelama sp. W311]